jgi:hypothetical protein
MQLKRKKAEDYSKKDASFPNFCKRNLRPKNHSNQKYRESFFDFIDKIPHIYVQED